MLVFKELGGVGNTTSNVCVCVCHTGAQTEAGGLTVINEVPRRCYFRLARRNNPGPETQLGQPSRVLLVCGAERVSGSRRRLTPTQARDQQTDRFSRSRSLV